jgi:hypothetical protein
VNTVTVIIPRPSTIPNSQAKDIPSSFFGYPAGYLVPYFYKPWGRTVGPHIFSMRPRSAGNHCHFLCNFS